jgi:flagellar biosynthesis GTPase FlhF
MLSELFETLPEVGDLEKPKMVFFFDEAHLLFNDAPKALLEKVEQVVKLIRSKGVGVYFCTQNPRDIPDGVLAQLGNKVQHGLRAYTPTDQKAVKAAADSFRENPDFDTYDTILNLGTGEAVISFLDEKGIPGVAENCKVLPPRCLMAGVSDEARDQKMKESLLYSKYAQAVDNFSAYELLQRLGVEEAEAKAAIAEQEAAEKEAARLAKEEEKEQARLEKERIKAEEKEARELQKKYEQMEKEAAKAEEKRQKELLKEYEKKEKERQRAIKSITNSVAGSVGREVGKNVGKSFGKAGRSVGGSVGASIARNIFGTLLKF